MINLDNQTAFAFDSTQLEKILQTLTDREVELVIVDSDTIKSLNYEYRGKNRPTDVLSFPLDGAFERQPLGSIVIAESFILEKSKELGHTPRDELALLFIHGLLHLLGYDHECDKGEMRAKERELIKKFDLPESLIVRTNRLLS